MEFIKQYLLTWLEEIMHFINVNICIVTFAFSVSLKTGRQGKVKQREKAILFNTQNHFFALIFILIKDNRTYF